MRIIKLKQDIVILRCAEVLPPAFLNQIEDYFQQLKDALDDEAESEVRLDRNDYIVVLETRDNVSYLN